MDAKNNTFNEDEDGTEAIAVIAMDGRFPGAYDLETFWQNIKNSKDSITHFSDQELANVDGQFLNNPRYVKARGIIKDIELFDAKFFGFSPREAILLDPQRRLFLELCWNALEKAGYCTDKYTGQIGVFAGMAHSSYLLQYLLKQKDNSVSTEDYEFFINTSNAFLTTEISYKLNLNGPSLNINTACSTSLVATVTACKQLLNYECDMALAGGVSILLPQKAGYLYQEGGIPSPDGHCRAFDATAAGTVPSAGAGVILLKRLEDAIADNDNIEAVIIGSAINNDGSNKVGFTAPSVMGQAKCIAEAIADAEISPESISYIEAHGTGTQLGDPIEIAALTKVFNSQTKKKQYCAIGSVKTNIGHTDNAAGIAGLIKTVFALKDKVLPPSLHFENPNPNIDFASSPFYVNTELKPWKSKEPRRAGVSSFGIGGTNAHVILEEAPKRTISSKSRPVQMLMLSTKTDSALDKATNNLAEFLQKRADNKSFLANDFADMAFTLQVGRKDFAYRRAIVCQDSDEAVEILQNQETLKNYTYVNNPENKPKIVFMFPGQGEQYPNMGLSLYKNEVVFKRCVDECRKILLEYINFDIRKILFPRPGEKKQAAELLDQTQYTQPALFVIEYALAKLFMSWGIKPQAVIGHSSGEYAAACIAGILSLQDALILITNRGKLTAQLEPGIMLAVSLAEDEILPLLNDDVFLSAVNSPTWCVISGSNSAIKKFKEKLRATYPEQRVRTVKLQISHAFHSDMMEPMLQKFSTLFKNIDTNPPQIPFISSATGKIVTESEIQNVDYWVNHIRNTVRFSAGIQELFSKQFNIFLELGPGNTLNALVKSHHFDGDIALIPSLCCTKNCVKKGPMAAKLTYQALAKLWLRGLDIDWQSYYKNELRHRVPLPTYPFERQRYWVDDDAKPTDFNPMLKRNTYEKWFYQPSWERESLICQMLDMKSLKREKLVWVVFKDNNGLGDTIVKKLQSCNQYVFDISKDSFDLKSKKAYENLISKVSQKTKAEVKVIHLWNLEHKIASIEESQYLGFYSLLFLSQACAKYLENCSINILIASTNLQNVVGNETIYPEKATLLGACRVIPQEHRNINICSIDLDSFHTTSDLSNFCNSLINEVLNIDNSQQKNIIAYRGNYRWLSTIQPYRFREENSIINRLRTNGVYLITGGLGGIGLSLAEYIAKTVTAPCIILTARSEFLPKNQWTKWLADHPQDNRTTIKIRILQNIQSLGAKIKIIQADVADYKNMLKVIKKTKESYGIINGVIHSAGIGSCGFSQFKTVKDAEKVLKSKLYGTITLINLFKDIDLDFFIMCSSLISLLSIPGQLDYCAANAVLDAVSHSRIFHNSTLVASIDWPAWKEVGMAVELENKEKFGELVRKNNISPEEGQKIFATILNSDLKQTAISVFDFNDYNQFLTQHITTAKSGNSNIDTTSKHKIKSIESNNAEEILQSLFQKILGVEKVNPTDDFFALGGHSLLALQLMSEIEKIFNVRMPLSIIYKSRTVNSLSKVVVIPELFNQPLSPLVALRHQGKKRPLFLIHPAGGTVFCYLPLARSIKNHPIYGLQNPSLETECLIFKNIEDITNMYMDNIRKVQAKGPYLLGGASLGGNLAIEIANKLHSQGEKIAAIFLMDSWGIYPKEHFNRDFFIKTMIRQSEKIRSQLLKAYMNYSDTWAEICWKFYNLTLKYDPPKVTEELILFKAKDLLPEYIDINDEFNYWQNYSTGKINLHMIPGDHETMLQEPHAGILAKKLQEYLDKID
jgi:acyl transferase domain-containing protein/thioesterase domain-containing protein/acyl carrier protein